MKIAFRVDLDIASDPSILQTVNGFRLGDKFIVKAYSHHDDPVVHEVVGILTQYVPNIRVPCAREQDTYLITDGLVIASDKAVKCED